MYYKLKQVFHQADGVSYEALREEKKALVSSGGAQGHPYAPCRDSSSPPTT